MTAVSPEVAGVAGVAADSGVTGAVPRYAPGGGVAIVHGGTWLFAPTHPTAQVIERCWHAVRGGADIDRVVSAILHDGFRAVPDFALVHVGADATNVVVRGAAAVDIAYVDGTRLTIDTGDAASLIERAVAGRPVALRLRGGELASDVNVNVDVDANVDANVDVARVFPLESGVVLASMLDFGAFVIDEPLDDEPVPEAEIVEVAEAASDVTRIAEAVSGVTRIAEAVSTVTRIAEAVPSSPVPGDQAEQVPDLDYIFTTTVTRDPRLEPTASTAAPAATGLLDEAMDWMPVQNPVAQPAAQPIIDAFDPSMPVRVAETVPVLDTAPVVESAPIVETAQVVEADSEATVFRPAARVAAADQPVVQAVRCPGGHLNDPAAVACRICRQRIPEQQLTFTPRPSLGRLRLSNGELLPLDRGVIFGRNPEAPEGYAGPRLSLIRLSTADDVSRNHVEIRFDGWRVLVIDLGSRNGTQLTRSPGEPAQALQPLQQYELESGMVISLAPDVWIAYEVTP